MTKIEWTKPPGYRGETWNPTVGCQRISAGCGTAKAGGCYAERMAVRLESMGRSEYAGLTNGDLRKPRWTGVVRALPDRLSVPLARRAPTCWFVDSMSDLFHEGVPDEFIAAVFGVMAATPQHRYIILTKRAERLPRWFAWIDEFVRGDGHEHYAVAEANNALGMWGEGELDAHAPWPLPNVILGVSVEDQPTADERIPHLLATPAAAHVVSYEPALAGVNFAPWVGHGLKRGTVGLPWRQFVDDAAYAEHFGFAPALHSLDQIIVGGESGPGARPFDPLWAHSVVGQCAAAGVPAFIKQMGSRPIGMTLRDKKGGDPSEWPESLRVRQWPAMLMDRAGGDRG